MRVALLLSLALLIGCKEKPVEAEPPRPAEKSRLTLNTPVKGDVAGVTPQAEPPKKKLPFKDLAFPLTLDAKGPGGRLSFIVDEVRGKDEMLVRSVSYSSGIRIVGGKAIGGGPSTASYSQPFLLRGYPTKGVVDGARIESIPDLLHVVDTTKAKGKTVFVVKVVDWPTR